MKKRAFYIGCVLPLVAVSCFGASPFTRYRYIRGVDGSFEQQELVATDLDGRMWKAIGITDIDVRIADQEGRGVPHLMRRAGAREKRMVRHRRVSRIDSLSDNEENWLELRLIMDKSTSGANVLSFETPLKDFEKTVSVWGVGEDGSETLLAERVRIFDYSRFADVRNTSVTWQEDSTHYREFRIRVEDVVDEARLPLRRETRRFEGDEETMREDHKRILTRAFRMDAVHLYEQRLEDAGRVPSKIELTFDAVTLRQKSDPVATVLDIEHNGAPLTALVLMCDDSNFSRRAIVEIPVKRDGREVWREIAAGQVSRISFRDFTHASLRINFPEIRSRRYRLTLLDHDNPPLQNVSIKGKGPVWQAVFFAEPDREYTVYYGAVGTPQPPRYDLAPLERLLGYDHEPLAVQLNTETDNPLFQKAGVFSGESAMRALFAVAIIVMLAVLALGLYRASRQIT